MRSISCIHSPQMGKSSSSTTSTTQTRRNRFPNIAISMSPKPTSPISQQIQYLARQNTLNPKHGEHSIPQPISHRTVKEQKMYSLPICIAHRHFVSSNYPSSKFFPTKSSRDKKQPWGDFRFPDSFPRKILHQTRDQSLIIPANHKLFLPKCFQRRVSSPYPFIGQEYSKSKVVIDSNSQSCTAQIKFSSQWIELLQCCK